MKKWFILLVLTGLLQASGLEFLNYDVGGRYAALAGNGLASSEDGFALFWNPALISHATHSQVALSQALWLKGTQNSYLGLVLPGKNWKLGFSVSYSEIDDIDVRDVPAIAPLGKTSWTDWYVGFTLSRLFKEKYAVGITWKKIYQNVFDENANGYALDLGINYNYSSRLNVGMAIKNIGNMSKLYQEESELPVSFEAGIWYREIKKLGDGWFNGGASIKHSSHSPDNLLWTRFALEYIYKNYFHVRSGYLNGADLYDWSTGFGFTYGVYQFDYAFKNVGDGFDDIHLFSLQFLF